MHCSRVSRVVFNVIEGGCPVTKQLKREILGKNVFKSQVRLLSSGSRKNLRIGVQGAELFMGQKKRGTELGPKVIRDTGLVSALQELGHDVVDYGNIPIMEIQEMEYLQMASTAAGTATGTRIPQTISVAKGSSHINLINGKQVAEANKLISDWTAKTLSDDRICLTLGGDHALGIGTVHGAASVYPDLGVLWIDAHSDINTPLTTESGNIHGMSVAFFIKELQSYLPQIPEFTSWIKATIPASNIAYIGLRDVDPAEATILEMLGIAAYSMQDVDKYGIQKVTEMALTRISGRNPSCPIHVSYDIDSICDSVIKSTGTPVPGGLTLREGLTLLERIYETGRLVSMDLVEVNPLLGSEVNVLDTARAAKHLILSAFGRVRGGLALNSIPKP